MYYVSRQLYWPDGDPVVEIAAGGLDYANPDMLCAQFAGEGETYVDPRDALEAAISIREAWKTFEHGRGSKVNPDEIRIECGFTGGYTLPFASYETDAELRAWAEKETESLPRCDWCGEIIEGESYWYESFDDEEFCSEFCAEERYADLFESPTRQNPNRRDQQ